MKLLALFILFSTSTFALSIGDKVPNFNLVGSDGKTYELEKLKGKTIVLEWFNHGCPFVRKFYDKGDMQKNQDKHNKDVVWLTVSSSAENNQGWLKDKEVADKRFKREKMKSKAILLDGKDGKVGKLFNAKTTPHMFIINKSGELAYQGAIDSIPSTDQSDISKAENYLDLALKDLKAGRKVAAKAKTRPYGCSVKY